MIFRSLASSSRGNAYIVRDGETCILLECGISLRKIQKTLGFPLSEIRACLVSHEHKDHAGGVPALLERGVEIYMSAGTAEKLGVDSVTVIESMEQFRVGTLDVVPFSTFHDAAEPLGFLVKSSLDGDVLAFATDTVNLRYRFPGVTILAIEANYDKEILLRSERLPEKVRRRIANTHLEIGALCAYLTSLELSTCREIYLLHLSDAMSREDDFVKRVAACVPRGIRILPCER